MARRLLPSSHPENCCGDEPALVAWFAQAVGFPKRDGDGVMNTLKLGLLGPALAGVLALAAAPAAHADYMFSGSGTSGSLDGASETWIFNADGGAAATGYLNDWGSPGVGAGTTAYSQTDAAYGMVITFSGGGPIDVASATVGNGANCAGSTTGGTTSCTIGGTDDIWQAFVTGPDTIQFLAQDSSFYLSQGQDYFVNIFFDGNTPTSFTGKWLTSFTPTPPTGVPEPGSIAMFGAGLLGLGLMLVLRRRRFG